VAREPGVPVGTVKARLARGRAGLARALDAEEREVGSRDG
jgi:DNA-directed RNA polymerase specialized sigma24 family protein